MLEKKIIVAASILSADFGRLNEEIENVAKAGVDWIHVDIMDGHFVPNLTFGVPVVQCLKSRLPLDCHLMVEEPEKYFDGLVKAGVYSITVHQEACVHLHRTLQKLRELGVKVGVSINPGTSVIEIEEVLDLVDMVLIMSVDPGFGGQKFINSVVKKIKEIKVLNSEVLVQVDGGINAETAEISRKAGADILVAGNFIFNAEDKVKAIQMIRGNMRN